MKVLFIEARKNFKEKIEKEFKKLESLPQEIQVLYTIQYKELARKIKKYLENKRHKIVAFQQVLGCSKIKPKAPILLIGSGKFHALQIALQTNKKIFIYNNGKIENLKAEEILAYKSKEKGKLIKFLSSDKIGLLVSLKPGQKMLKESLQIKKKLEEKYPSKKFYIFIANEINIKDLENFPLFFINLACPGINLDSSSIINYKENSI
jgi:diphthamide biosynthesis enzyme Dph1/Dph2-like protein